MNRPIKTLMIANRGEIASRVIRTAHRMGMHVRWWCLPSDRHHPFVMQADEAIPLQGQTATKPTWISRPSSGLHRKMALMRFTPVMASCPKTPILPAVVNKQVCYLSGRPASAIDAMGSKAEAKHRMAAAGVPIPGYLARTKP